MAKISECDSLGRLCHRCQYFLNSPHLICAVNPCGPAGETCDDFEAIAQADTAPERQPLGGGYYAGDWIPQPFPTLTAAEQLALLDWHPQFTGRCPECEIPIAESEEGQ
jgi:hypothetical protein